eukprot:m.1673159 g.1673159  ORF g.1673159 m.1673159 type:complete len:77 (+) comp175987_c0_seq1:3-233(+)
MKPWLGVSHCTKNIHTKTLTEMQYTPTNFDVCSVLSHGYNSDNTVCQVASAHHLQQMVCVHTLRLSPPLLSSTASC